MFKNCSFAKRPRAAHMFNHGWWRLAIGGGWWRLAAVGGWRLVVGGGCRLAVGGWWRLVAVGGWRWWSLGAVPKGDPQPKKKIWVP